MDERQTISVRVKNPRTHIRESWWDSCYTDYEIALATDGIIFAKQTSKVRRTYSEFAWLDKCLSNYGSITIKRPVLPGNKVFGRFKRAFLEKRSQDLQQYLVGVLQIIPYLSDVALHLFLQTDLSVKEMERVLSGKDNRNISEIIITDKRTHQRECKVNMSSSALRDSGYSGSLHDGIPEVEVEDSGWVSLYVNHGSGQILGNGWSSGCTCASQTSPVDCQSRSPPRQARRLSPPTRAAAVLPGGQLVLPSEPADNDAVERWLDSASQSQQNDEDFSVIYDADNETDPFQSDYDIIPEDRRLRVREWLNSTRSEEYDECDSSDEEAELSPSGLRLPEYDVISVPCLKVKLVPRCRTLQSAAQESDEDSESGEWSAKFEDGDDDNRSCFSVLHSSIDGLDFQDRDELSASCDSSSSAKLFKSYDVIEMIELKYLTYHLV